MVEGFNGLIDKLFNAFICNFYFLISGQDFKKINTFK